MKLLTKEETDRIYYDITVLGSVLMDSEVFNEAVNKLLMDKEIVKSLLKRVKKIKAKL